MGKDMYKKMKRGIVVGIVSSILVIGVSYGGWVQNGTDYMYFNETSNSYVVNNWIHTSDGYYYMNASGKMQKGWAVIGNDYYYFNENGLMQTGFISAGGGTYYLDPTGKMIRGWLELVTNGKAEYFYFDTNGQMVSGWKKINDFWYYFNEGKCIIDSWAMINNEWFRFNIKGQMVVGWYLQDGKYYYLNQTTGVMQKGWIQDVNGYKYFLSTEDGSMIRNQTVTIDGIQYTFNESGQLINNNSSLQDLNYKANFSGSGIGIGISPGSSNANVNAVSSTITQATNAQQSQALIIGSTTGPA